MNTPKNLKNHILPVCNFLSKGWEVSILGLLVFMQQKHGFGLSIVGLLSTVFIVSQVAISAFAGKIAHVLHSRNVILLSIVFSAMAWLILIFTGNLTMIFLAFVFGGLSSGLFEPIGNSLVAKSSPRNRAIAIGNFAAFGDMGRIAMAAAAVAIAGFIGLTPTFAILMGTTLFAFGITVIFNRNLADPATEVKEEHIDLGQLLRNSKFCYATLAGIADSFSSASLYIFIPFLLVAKGILLANTGWYIGVFFCGYFMGRLGLGRLADRYGAANTLMLSKIAMSVLILALIFASGSWPIIGLIFMLGIFTRGSSPIIRTMVADSMDDNTSFHNAFGTYSFASRGSSAICRPIFGYVASSAGIAAVFYIASIASIVTLYPASKYKKNDAVSIAPPFAETECAPLS
jgi:FSR family fosmidomycin resistance protein-like MFS transporter